MFAIVVVVVIHLFIIVLSHTMITTICTIFGRGSGTIRNNACLHGKTAIITGGNSGIGFYTALELASRGARVILACRDLAKATAAKRRIVAETGNMAIVVQRLDLASFRSVRAFCAEITKKETHIDILVNNAGAIQLGNHLTEDNLQITWQINYFAPFLLTSLLLDSLEKSNATILNVTGRFCAPTVSLTDLNAYHNEQNVMVSDLLAYFNAKSALYAFSQELSRRNAAKCKIQVFEAQLNSSHFWRRLHIGVHAIIYLGLHLLCSAPQTEATKVMNVILGDQNTHTDCEDDEYLSGELWRKTCEIIGATEGH